MTLRTLAWFAVIFLTAVVFVTCSAPQRAPAESLRLSKCGGCHIAPAGGTLSRSEADDVAVRHAERVLLTDEEWTMLTNHLSSPAPELEEPVQDQ